MTGATGFIGREVLRRAPGDLEVVALARRDPGVPWIAADLAEALPDPGPFDVLVHLAQAGDYRTLEHATDVVDVNVGGTARVLDLARRHGARVVHASTATVLRCSDAPLDEDAPIDARGIYAASKRSAELVASAYADDVPVWCLRIFGAYGPGQRDRLVADLVERVSEGRAVTVQGERGLLQSPVHVADVADAVLAAAGRAPAGMETVNVGGPDALGIGELAQAIGEAVDREPVLERVDGPEPGGYVADLTRLRATFALEPRRFADGIRDTVAVAT